MQERENEDTNIEAEQLHPLIKNEVLKDIKTTFVIKMLVILVGYIVITLWLNSIRMTASIWFVWVLIVIQFTIYFSIFTASYKRFKECGYKRFGIIPFALLAFLGRVENWELVIIPLLITSMFVISARVINSQMENYDN